MACGLLNNQERERNGRRREKATEIETATAFWQNRKYCAVRIVR